MTKRLLPFLLLLESCGINAEIGKLDTPSGRPEITVRADRASARNACAEWLIEHEYTINGSGDPVYTITGEREKYTSFWDMSWDADAKKVIWETFSFVSHDSNTTTIYCSRVLHVTPTSGNTYEEEMKYQDDYDSIQLDLKSIVERIKNGSLIIDNTIIMR